MTPRLVRQCLRLAFAPTHVKLGARSLMIALALGCTLQLAVPARAGEQESLVSAGAPAPGSDARFDVAPDFSFTTANGELLTRADLAGAPWIAVPFFVRCTGPCPSITRDLRSRLYDDLSGTQVRIVSFSVDPELDTAEELASYVAGLDIDARRWTFVTAPTEAAMHAFLNEGLKLPVQRAEGETDPGQAVVHGTRLALVDSSGQIAGWYEVADPSEGASPIPLDEADAILEGRYGLLLARARELAGLEYVWPPQRASRIPLINASLNGTAFVLLVLGIVAIKAGRKGLHERLMKLAFLVSAAFLACYLYYHFVVLPISGGPTKYNGTGVVKTLYLVMLLSHIVLAVVNLPMVLRVLWLARKEDWPAHRRLAKWTFPIWAYVSLTGVLVYLVLYPFNPPPA